MLSAESLATAAIDDFLRLVAEAKHQRRPVEWLTDRLLEMRSAIG